VDHSDIIQVHDVNTRAVLFQVMGGDGYEWSRNKSEAIVHLNSSSKRSHGHLLYMAHIFFRYRLLDIYADALGLPVHNKLGIVPRAPRPSCLVRRLSEVSSSMVFFFLQINKFPLGLSVTF
jgi:hypothetical protein